MLTPINSNTSVVQVNHCNGHKQHVKKCYSRQEVRENSARILNEYNQNAEIQTSTTHMVEGKEKRKLLGKKRVYDLFINYIHKDDCSKCDNFYIEKTVTKVVINQDVNPKTEATVETVVEEIFYDAVEELPLSEDEVAQVNSEATDSDAEVETIEEEVIEAQIAEVKSEATDSDAEVETTEEEVIEAQIAEVNSEATDSDAEVETVEEAIEAEIAQIKENIIQADLQESTEA